VGSGENHFKREFSKLFQEFKAIQKRHVDIQKNVQQEAANDLSEYYTRHQQPDSALFFFKKHVAFRDSLQSEQNKKQVTRLEMQYEFDKKETFYKQEQLLSEARVREKDLLLKVSQEQLTRSQQEQKIQQLAFQNAQNQLQVAELGRLELERKKELAEKEKNEQAALLKVVSQEAELAKLRNRQQILYASLGIALLILLSGFLVSKARTRQVRLRNELERQRAEQLNRDLAHERQLLESELKTIRSQMNPHFIFNVLNSIESYILEKEPETASRLVQKFATLSRLILEHSTQSYVTADVEWRVLKLYVELEAVRFNHQFAYHFDADTDLPMAELRIPPMLVQPLVENAILHGLRPYAENDGMLRVSLVQGEKEIVFTVSDNGVGLNTNPKQTENPFSVKRQSIALKAIRDRVELINQVAKEEVASFELKDKREEGSHGTEAILRLPVQLEVEQRVTRPLL
jgi:anti-sigma regulatory factor (Ser/Thr protein kinase)